MYSESTGKLQFAFAHSVNKPYSSCTYNVQDVICCFENVRLKSGNEVTVSVSDLASCPSTPIQISKERENVNNSTESIPNKKEPVCDVSKTPPLSEQTG